ncbi:MAG TPA: hypothetical protein VJA23_06160 [Candidatus Nanoarchaeia archaeon]|nr:hypothetical protein [Candidatus Nanoarchaeia archaeon]
MIQEYTQSTFESCLAVDLLNLTETKISPKKERKVLDYALDYSKYHFTLGHLDFVATEFKVGLDYYIDNKLFFNFTKQFRFSGKINLFQEKIDLRLIDKLIKTSPVIVYLDAFVIWKITHAPHFIIVIENSRKGYKIYDPWDGKIRLINSTVLSKAIISLRNLLKYCPQLIQKK